MSCSRASLPIALLALVLAACGSQPIGSSSTPAERPRVLVLPEVTYARTAAGRQISAEDDRCDTPRLLSEALRDRLPRPYVVASGALPQSTDAATLRLAIEDLHLRNEGTTAGRKWMRVRGVLDQEGMAPLHFVVQREIHVPFGVRRSVCHAALHIAESLSGDIAAWLKRPVDAAVLVNGP